MLLSGVAPVLLFASAAGVSPASAQTCSGAGQMGFDNCISEATQPGQNDTVDITIGTTSGTVTLGQNLVLPGAANGIQLNFIADPGTPPGDGQFNVNGGAQLTIGSNAGVTFEGNGRFNVGFGAGQQGSALLSGGTVLLDNVGGYSVLNVGHTGGTGTFTQTSGSVTSNNSAFQVGYNGGTGTYNMSGGSFTFNPGSTIYVGEGNGGNGTLNITGNAQFTTTPPATSGTQIFVGANGGTGRIVQDGAGSLVSINTGNNAFWFGASIAAGAPAGHGSYELRNGTFQVLSSTQGITFGRDVNGTGDFIQSGGSFTSAGAVTIGLNGQGTYTLSGGTSTMNGGLNIASGSTGRGEVNQTGGAATVNGNIQFGTSTGTGTYRLAGGTLTTQGITGGNANSEFIFAGGTLIAGTGFTTSSGFSTILESTSTIQVNGTDNLAWSSIVSGGGGLIKTGDGTLTLTAANTFTGPTAIADGTLALTGAGSIGALAALTVGSDGRFDISGVTAIIPGTGVTGVALASLSGGGTVVNGLNTLVTGLDNGNSSFSGTIVNSGNSWDANFGRFVKAGTGTLTIDGATIQGGEAHVIGGALAQTGGTTTVDYLAVGSGTTSGTPNVGALNISGGNFNVGVALQVGDFGGTGTVNQTGGTVSVQATCGDPARCVSLNVGNQGGTGFYNISGGELLLRGGSHSIGRNTDGNPAGSGTLRISGSGLVEVSPVSSSERGFLVIGDRDPGSSGNSTGVVNQTGGTLRIVGASELYLGGFGSSIYNLTGGTLEIGGASLRGNYLASTGPYAFNLGGGTVRVIGSALTTSVDATLVSGTSSTIDTNGLGATWSGALSGDGALVKAGAGTLTLAAANTYTGGTVINAGTLALSGAGTLGGSSGATTVAGGTLDLGGTTQVQNGGVTLADGAIQNGTLSSAGAFTLLSGTVGATLEGSGGVVKNGDGTVVLSGANAYTGGTTINGGALAVSSEDNLGGPAGGLAFNGGALQALSSFALSRSVALGAAGGTIDTNGFDLAVGSTIDGSGGLTKSGAGTLTFNVPMTYTGGTTVAAGTLQLLNGASLAPTGALAVNGGTFDMSQLGAGLTVGALSGAGGVIALGANTLTTDSAASTTSASVITGAGGLVKEGGGVLTLTGASTYSGATTVNAGALVVDGSLASTVTLNGGGMLGGSGTIGGLVSNGGTVAPGNSIGTLNIAGNFAQNGGVYQVEVNPAGQSDLIDVGGTATINGGTVQVLAAGGNYARNTTYTILSATGGVSGAYSDVTSNFAFLTPSLSYDANNVFLSLFMSQSAFAAGARTANQYAVGTALDRANATATGDFNTVLDALSVLSTQQGPWALNQISGQPYADFGTFNVASNALFMNALGQQMALARGGQASGGQRVALAQACEVAACEGASPFSVWASALGGAGSVQGDGNSSTFTYNLGGAAAGIDHRVAPWFLVGIGVGYTSGTQWVDSFQGKGWSNAVSVAAYGSFTQSGFYADLLAGYAYANNQMQRQIAVPGLQPRTASGSTGANQFLGQVEVGYEIPVFAAAQATVTPFARFQASSINQAAFSEWGADSLSLDMAQQTTTSLRTTFGAALGGAIGLGDARTLDLMLRLGWQHEYADTARPITAAFAGAPFASFTVYGATPQRNAAVIGFSAGTKVTDNAALFLRYDGELASGTDNHALNLGVRIAW